jgi:acetoin:2,6-dichlorophenolindophenol oxidoreductase subunit alpha
MTPIPPSTPMLDRRTLLKLIGSVGASATVSSACSAPFGSSVSAQGLTGGKFDKSVPLATAGPGGNPAWQPGDAVRFLPPLEIPTRGAASDTLAALPREQLLRMYELMATSRRWETAMKDLFLAAKDNLYGAFHTYVGEEAVAVGVIGALNDDDYIASTHRGLGHLIAKGGDLDRMSAEIFFKATGYNKGYGGSMHITDMSRGIMGMNGIVVASFYMAAGAALRAKVRGTKQVAVAFYGDGAAASPYYFSAVRSAANQKVPVLFVNENNFQYMGVPMALTVPTKYVAELTKGLDIPHHVVDGNDLSAVYHATTEAVRWAREGKGPSVIEAITYRWYDHSGFAGGRVAQEGAMDPLLRYKTWLTAKGLATEADLGPIETRVEAAVARSIEFARSSPDPRPEDGVFNTYADGAVEATQFFNRKGLSTDLT